MIERAEPIQAPGADWDRSRQAWNDLFFWILLAFNIALYLWLSVVLERSLFAPRLGREIEDVFQDGFYAQITLHIDQEESPALWLWIRYWLVSPFLFLEDLPGRELTQAVVTLAFSLPIVTAKYRGTRSILQQVLLFFPILVNYRLAIGMYSVSYLFIFVFARERRLLPFIFYGLCSVMSTGTMLIYTVNVLRAGFQWKSRIGTAVQVVILGAVAYFFSSKIISLYGSMTSEQYDAYGVLGEGRPTTVPEYIWELIQRSNIGVNIQEGRLGNLLFLIGEGAIMLLLMVHSYAKRLGQVPFFFLSAFLTLFGEGLASYSFIGSVLLYLLWSRHAGELHEPGKARQGVPVVGPPMLGTVPLNPPRMLET